MKYLNIYSNLKKGLKQFRHSKITDIFLKYIYTTVDLESLMMVWENTFKQL